ncbi:MAG: hypothetical protein PHQ47_00495 [Candidatus Portnoybacteria bacterium]|nr:hypothetical protein [Candidatus Portnoybacteria bacterium]
MSTNTAEVIAIRKKPDSFEAINSLIRITGERNLLYNSTKTLAEFLKIERCVVFQTKKAWCKLLTGFPPEEHGIDCKERNFSEFPDLESVWKEKKPILISSPATDSRTRHFVEIIKQKKINQIFYIPVLSEKTAVCYIIAADATGERTFSAEDQEFCVQFAKLLSLILIRDSVRFDPVFDALKNGIAEILSPLTKVSKYSLLIHDLIRNKCHQDAEKSCQFANLLESFLNIIYENALRLLLVEQTLLNRVTKIKMEFLEGKEE